ncbi:MAG: hypothetical protein PHC46_02600 [Clostridia bacterium]|nr:hypothetical protein [Clostridia bacterium]
MKPEIIIVGAVLIIGLYIFTRMSISSKKMNKKNPLAKTSKDDKVELKTVIAPKPDAVQMQRDYNRSEEDIMKKAALESIEDEKNWKTSLLREEKLIIDEKRGIEQSELDKKLAEMQQKLSEIDFNEEEQTFVEEVNQLSPQIKAILFAELLNKKGY